MRSEVRYAEEPIEGAGPVRVLCQDGEWLVPESERPPLRLDEPVRLAKRPVFVPRPPQVRAPAPKSPKAPIDRSKLTQAACRANYRGDLTARVILERTRQGKPLAEIQAEFGVSYATVCNRIERSRKDPAFREAYKALQVCRCGRKKWAHLPHCGECTTRATLRARRLDRAKARVPDSLSAERSEKAEGLTP